MPEGSKNTRYDELSKAGDSRIEMPELVAGEHILQWLFEFGPSLPTTSGPGPVTFSEIHSWAVTTQTQITSEEALILRSLSRDYCGQFHASTRRTEPPPYAKGGDNIGAGIMAAVRLQKGKLNG